MLPVALFLFVFFFSDPKVCPAVLWTLAHGERNTYRACGLTRASTPPATLRVRLPEGVTRGVVQGARRKETPVVGDLTTYCGSHREGTALTVTEAALSPAPYFVMCLRERHHGLPRRRIEEGWA